MSKPYERFNVGSHVYDNATQRHATVQEFLMDDDTHVLLLGYGRTWKATIGDVDPVTE